MDYTPPHAIYAEVTSYAPRSVACQTTNITANGTNTDHVPYGIAADKSIPFGSIIYIPPGYGYLDRSHAFQRGFTVDDRGGGLDSELRRITSGNSHPKSIDGCRAMFNNDHVRRPTSRIDLRVKDVNYATSLGRQRLIVYISYPIAPE